MTATTTDDDDQKRNLIQQATTRLRRLQLEEQLSGMMAGLMDLQTQSQYFYDQLSHAMSTTQNLQDFDIGQQHQQMDLLEIQCKLYQQVMLHQGFPTVAKNGQTLTMMDATNDDHDSTSMSRHSSLSMIPSIFSSGSISSLTSSSSSVTSISEFTDMGSDHNNADEGCSSGGDLCAAAATEPEKKAPMGDQHLGRCYQRRLRVKYHRQRYQYRQQQMKKTDDQDSVLADLAMASTTSPSPSLSLSRQHQDLHQNATSMHLLDKMETSPPSSFFSLPPSPAFSSIYRPSPPAHTYPYNNNTNDVTGYCDTGLMDDNSSDISFSDYGGSSMDSYRPRYHQYGNNDTTVDDFLDQMDAIVKDIDDCDGYDELFFQDMAFLLDQPLEHAKEVAPQLTAQQHWVNDTDRSYSTMDLSPESTHGPSSSSSSPSSPYIDHLCHSGWQWCRFLSVLSASYMVSLLKGPDDLLLD